MVVGHGVPLPPPPPLLATGLVGLALTSGGGMDEVVEMVLGWVGLSVLGERPSLFTLTSAGAKSPSFRKLPAVVAGGLAMAKKLLLLRLPPRAVAVGLISSIWLSIRRLPRNGVSQAASYDTHEYQGSLMRESTLQAATEEDSQELCATRSRACKVKKRTNTTDLMKQVNLCEVVDGC